MKKKIVLFVHGFMVHDWHDFHKYIDYVKANEQFSGYEYKLVYLYDRKVPKTSKPKKMYYTLKNEVSSYINQGYEVSLIGYSFSCSIVARVAKDFNLKGVIYFAPAINLIKTKLLKQNLITAKKALKIRMKYGNKKADKIMEKTKTKGVVILSLHICFSMIKYRKYFKSNVPFLLIRGHDDTSCLEKDIYKILSKTKADKVIYYTQKGEEWNHFFVLREKLIPQVALKVTEFLNEVM